MNEADRLKTAQATSRQQYPDLSVTVGRIAMRNPVMVASGTFGYGSEYAELVDLDRLGAVVVKGISLEPAPGNAPPRMAETYGGLLNAIGLQNPGVAGFVAEHMPFLRRYKTPVIVNIWGRTLEEYGAVAERLDSVEGVAGLELNISCPNIKAGGIAFGTDPRAAAAVTALVRAKTRLPVIPKLPPNVPDITVLARAVRDAGADAVSLVNSFPAMAIDIETRRPKLANVTGGLTGPAIHPIAVKLVWEASRAVDIPVIGIGGISTAADAIEMLIAGACAVAVGTANFTDPTVSLKIADGIRDYLAERGFRSVREIVGTVRENCGE